MRDNYLNFIKNKNIAVPHGAVVGSPRCGMLKLRFF